MQPYYRPADKSHRYRSQVSRKRAFASRRVAAHELRILLPEDEEIDGGPNLRLVDFAETLEEFHVASGDGDVERTQELLDKLREILKCEPTAAVIEEWLERVRLALTHAVDTIAVAQKIARTSTAL